MGLFAVKIIETFMNAGPYLVRLRPRPKTLHISQGRSVFESDSDGLIASDSAYGFFVHEARVLSRYEYRINEIALRPIAASSVREHSFLGYYVVFPPERSLTEKDLGSGEMEEVSEQTVELRVSRYVGGGLHEDLDLRNFTQQETRFRFSILLAADFIDRNELHSGRQQLGELACDWRRNENNWELQFDYSAENDYDCQGERGRASLHRGVVLRIFDASSEPRYHNNTVSFDVALGPKATWHTCLDVIPKFENEFLKPKYSC